MPPRASSPVIDAGGTNDKEFDQRGLPRSHGAKPGLGAVEYQGETLEWIAGFNADSDGDRAPNGLEFTLGPDLFVFEPEAILKLDGNRGNLSLVFQKPSLFYSNFVTIQVHQSNSLTNSFEKLFSNRIRPFETSGENIIIPLQPNGARFFRLEATLK